MSRRSDKVAAGPAKRSPAGSDRNAGRSAASSGRSAGSTEHTGAAALLAITPRQADALLDAVVLGVLILDGALLGLLGLLFTPLYRGAVPVPMGALLSLLILPWLIARAAELDPRPAVAAGPFLAWALVIGVVGLTGPGGDVLLPATWQSVLLCGGGLVVSASALRRVRDNW